MSEVVETIPTLTDIVEVGDVSMRNHFDAHQFETSENTSDTILENSFEDDLHDIIEASNIIENAGTSEIIDTDTDFEIPSIKFDTDEQSELPDQIFPDDDDLNNEIKFHTVSDMHEIDTNDIKEKIDQAVKTILPAIENQLKEQLYKEFEI